MQDFNFNPPQIPRGIPELRREVREFLADELAQRSPLRGEMTWAGFEIAAAKLRANRAVGPATSITHQVHGAIGFTREYRLHGHTRRVMAWRSEYGNDRHWARHLGSRVAARGADNFWTDLTARSDSD